MNNNNNFSLEEQIQQYSQQMLHQYSKSSTPPPAVPEPAPEPAPPHVHHAPATEEPAPVPPVSPMPPTPEEHVHEDHVHPESTPPPPTTMPSSTAASAYERYAEAHPQRGILRVQTLTARSTFPVQGAKITVSKVFDEGEHIIAMQLTDNAGRTEGLLLPAPDRSLSEHPNPDHLPYGEYKLTVTHPDYATVIALRLPIFAGESSLQILNLIPPAASPNGDTIQYITTEPSDL